MNQPVDACRGGGHTVTIARQPDGKFQASVSGNPVPPIKAATESAAIYAMRNALDAAAQNNRIRGG